MIHIFEFGSEPTKDYNRQVKHISSNQIEYLGVDRGKYERLMEEKIDPGLKEEERLKRLGEAYSLINIADKLKLVEQRITELNLQIINSEVKFTGGGKGYHIHCIEN